MRSDLAPRTALSLTDPEEIMSRIAAARDEGHAIIDQEVEIGLRSIAVPLRNARGRTVAALNLGMAAAQENAAALAETYLSEMHRVQAGLERVIG